MKKNTILVFEEAGQVHHCFTTKVDAEKRLNESSSSGSGGCMFYSEGIDAEMVFSVSQDMRERVEEAKRKLRADMAIRDALNRNGVPAEPILRARIFKAINELRATVLQPLVV